MNAPSERESYFAQSRRPLASLVFVLPLVLVYEVGTHWFHVDIARQTETRVLAFTWIREGFARLGATGALLPPAAVIGLLLGWHIFTRQPNRLRTAVPLCMAGESALLALPLLLLVGAMTGHHLLGAIATPVGFPADQSWAALIILGIGAGVYEELVFRLIGFVLLHALLVDLLALRERTALVLTLVLTSVAFAAYHHIGGVEPFAWPSFIFRSVAGLWLGGIFALRGFGVAAGAHAAYDMLLVTLLWRASPEAF